MCFFKLVHRKLLTSTQLMFTLDVTFPDRSARSRASFDNALSSLQ